MSDSSNLPWSNGPNAPQIPHSLYSQEKEIFVGLNIAVVTYGEFPHVHVNLVRLADPSRDRHRSVPPMYERIAIPRPSHNEGHQVGTCGPHYYHVLVSDDRPCDEPEHPLDFLHR